MTQEFYSNWRTDLSQLDEFLGGKPGDGFIGPSKLDSKNPLAKKQKRGHINQFCQDPMHRRVRMSILLTTTFGDRKMQLDQLRRELRKNQSYKPEGEVVEGYDDGDVIRPTDRMVE